MVKRLAKQAALAAERHIERRLHPRRALGKVAIASHRGFGRAGELFVRGRVMVDRAITRSFDHEPVWRSLVNSYRRFQSAEIAGERVIGRYRDSVVETVSDDEGYFRIRLEPHQIDPDRLWHDVTLELPRRRLLAKAEVLVPRVDVAFGIISDVDDTIVQTGATSVLRMIRTVALQNAKARLPFEGVAELYRALHADRHPLFYVSSSPWNLHDLICDYIDLNGIPRGPLFLQDWGFSDDRLVHAPHDAHKLEQIGLLLDYYASLPFVLIGDSGQRDPEIYLQVIRSFPGRIRVAFIRDVTHDLRDRTVARIIGESNAAGVEMLFVRDSAEAMTHARRLGLV